MRIAIIISVVVVIIIIAYFYNKTQTAKREADIKVAEIAANVPPPCFPFTQADQDKQKRDGYQKCYVKLLNPVPALGKIQYYNCTKDVKENLTPIKNC